jgi:hypothetical protein
MGMRFTFSLCRLLGFRLALVLAAGLVPASGFADEPPASTVLRLNGDGTWKLIAGPPTHPGIELVLRPDGTWAQQELPKGGAKADPAAQLVSDFFGAGSWPGATRFLRNGKVTARCAERASSPDFWLRRGRVVADESTALGEGARGVVVTGTNKIGGSVSYQFVVTPTEAGLLIDWERSTQEPCNSPSLSILKSQLPDGTFVVRVLAELSDYYGFAYGGQEEGFVSFRVRDGTQDDVYAYALRTSVAGRSLAAAIGETGGLPAVIRLRFTRRPGERTVSSITDLVEVLKIGSWD